MNIHLATTDTEIEETNSYITVRMKGNMHATGLFGGMAFGVHRIDKNLVHTLKPM